MRLGLPVLACLEALPDTDDRGEPSIEDRARFTSHVFVALSEQRAPLGVAADPVRATDGLEQRRADFAGERAFPLKTAVRPREPVLATCERVAHDREPSEYWRDRDLRRIRFRHALA